MPTPTPFSTPPDNIFVRRDALSINPQCGFTLVELMIGVFIGTLALYAAYAAFALSEANRRQIAAVNDTQLTGLYALFLLRHSVGNAGFALMANRYDLDDPTSPLLLWCPMSASSLPTGGSFAGEWSYHPTPVAIIPTEADMRRAYDVLNLFYGKPLSGDLPLAAVGTQGANLIDVPAAHALKTGNRLIGLLPQGDGEAYRCEARTVTAVSATSGDSTGPMQMTVSLDRPFTASPAKIINLGQVIRQTFYVNSGNNLQMANWDEADHSVRLDPIATNVMVFRAQYGIDTDADGGVDQWLNPEAVGDSGLPGSPPAWTAILPSERGKESAIPGMAIKALRVGIVLRSDVPDRTLANAPAYVTTLFDTCGAETCKVQVELAASVPGGGYGYRFQKFETVIPLANTLWNG